MSSLAATGDNTARLRKAVHHHKLASKRGMLERMFTLWFRGFVYNQIWEDPRVDAEALRLGPESSLLTISSGGCNVLNYLVHQPKRIVAVDLNANHMSLTRLKLAALEHLPDYESFYKFFGYGRHPDNVPNYQPLHPRPPRPDDAEVLGDDRLAGQGGRPEADRLLQARPLREGEARPVLPRGARDRQDHRPRSGPAR